MHDAGAIELVLKDDRLPDRLVVAAAEPPSLLERTREHLLERWRNPQDEVLRLLQPSRIGDRSDRGIELGVGVGAVRH